MARDTDGIRRRNGDTLALDEVDRKLLGLLAEDATLTYAELGKRLNLSAPAVHERARRLKQAGVIQRTVAVLDADLVGKPPAWCMDRHWSSGRLLNDLSCLASPSVRRR